MIRARFVLPVVLAVMATPVLARPGGPGGWGARDAGWGNSGWPDRRAARSGDSREGKVEVARFRADSAAADALGKGAIAVAEAAAPGEGGDPRELATYQAAVIDRLAHGGYETAGPAAASAQIVEVRVVHAIAVPQEAPHKPVSGEMSMGVSNHGSMMGLGIAIDLTKPRAALVSTRLEARIRDRASGEVLWEGRADILTREGDPRWTGQEVATRLADALFDGFPLAR